jgi:hypothetical protein
MMKKYVLPLILVSLVIAVPALAQSTNPATDLFVNVGQNDFMSIIMKLITILLGVIGVVSILFIILGGFQYMTSGANASLAEQGMKTLKYAVMGLIIVILSYTIVVVIVNSLFKVN